MSFLYGLVADVIEWLLSKLFSVIRQDFAAWQAQRKSDAALAANQAALQSAIQSGDANAEQQAGENSLNNSGGQ